VVVLIVHQDRLVIDLLRNELQTPEIRVIGTLSSAEAEQFSEAHLPDLVILDSGARDSASFLARIRSNDHPCAVVALCDTPEAFRALTALGIETIVDKEAGLTRLLDAARSYISELSDSDTGDLTVSEAGVSQRSHVLVVDDEVDFQNLLAGFLTKQGYRVSTARNGKEALEIIGNGDAPKVMLVDIRMPEMGGLELLSHLQSQRPTPGVLLLTALNDLEIARRAAELGAFDYILKPFDFDQLGESVKACLDEVEYQRRPWWKRLIT
jgi:DNA-binding response OmpR family regulator